MTISLNRSNEVNSIQLFSITGQLVKNVEKPTPNNNKVVLENIPSGVYFLKVKSDTAFSIKKLIVQ